MESNPRLYFAYGSNLSLLQMASRCPTSAYHSFGLLRDYKWIIGKRGYANVLKVKETDKHIVYGMLYALQPHDEELLDLAEGVPHAYSKHVLEVEIKSPENLRGKVKALVYVDKQRLNEGVCWPEYVERMNRGIKDAIKVGMEQWYVDKYIRPFVPADGGEGNSEKDIKDPFHPRIMGGI